MNPQSATADDYVSFGRNLLNQSRSSYTSFEDAAQYITRNLYENLTDDSGQPAFALIRIYRLTTYNELSESLKSEVNPEQKRWLTLMGTYGHESAWRDRWQSQGHKAVEIGTNQSLMMQAALSQLEPSLNMKIDPVMGNQALLEATGFTRIFHVENAVDSPFFPAQAGFIKPYGIQSGIGVGNGFLSGSLYTMFAFSTVRLNAAQATAFSKLSVYIGTILAIYDARRIWN